MANMEMKTYMLQNCFSLRARIGWQGLRSEEFKTEGPYLVTGTDFHNGHVDWDGCYHVTEERYRQDRGIQLKEHDLLITKDGTIGKTAVVIDCPDKATLNSGVFVVRAIGKEVLPEYLFYILQSRWFDDFVNNVLTGSTIKHLNQEKFYRFSFNAPDIKVQEKIVEVLQSIDDTINDSKEMLKKKKWIRDGIFHDIFAYGLDKNGRVRQKDDDIYKESPIGLFPAKWDIVPIGSIVSKVGSGATPRGGESVYTSEGVLFIRSQDVTSDGLNLNGVAHIPTDVHARMNRSHVIKNDVLLNITGASIGRSCVYTLDEEANVNQHVCIIRHNMGYEYSVLLHKWLFSSFGQKQIKTLMTGSNREGLNFDQIKRIYVPVIKSERELQRIVGVIENIDADIIEEQQIIRKYEFIKMGLIQDLLMGRVSASLINNREAIRCPEDHQN